jgi:hypothetical protein
MSRRRIGRHRALWIHQPRNWSIASAAMLSICIVYMIVILAGRS